MVDDGLGELPLEKQLLIAQANEALAWQFVIAADSAQDGLSFIGDDFERDFEGSAIYVSDDDLFTRTKVELVGEMLDEYLELRKLLDKIEKFREKLSKTEEKWVVRHHERQAIVAHLESVVARNTRDAYTDGRYISKSESGDWFAAVYIRYAGVWHLNGQRLELSAVPSDLIPLTA